MERKQQTYLTLLQSVRQKALTSKIEAEATVNICLDLLLREDLAPYTGAMVCLTICKFAEIKNVPQKVAIGKDALRIARELKDELDLQRALWKNTYDQLVQDAEKVVEKAGREEKEQEVVTAATDGNTETGGTPNLCRLM